MGKNYSVDRDTHGRFRHSYVFMRGTTVSIKLFGEHALLKGTVSTIEKYYLVLDVAAGEEMYQVTINLASVKYIKHDCFPTAQERSFKGDVEDRSTSFVFDVGAEIKCAFRDGKGVTGELLSEGAYYLYIKTGKGSYLTVMKSALDFIMHKKHDPKLLVDDFFTEEMKAEGYKKPTEYVFSVGDAVSLFLHNGREISGTAADESKYWILLDTSKGQVTVLKSSYAYMKHDVYDTKARLYVENRKLKKQLRK